MELKENQIYAKDSILKRTYISQKGVLIEVRGMNPDGTVVAGRLILPEERIELPTDYILTVVEEKKKLEVNKIYQGNVLEVLKTFPDESIDMSICSPPYWGLRAYGTNPQIWDGDKNCDHIWGDDLESAGSRSSDSNSSSFQKECKGSINRDKRPKSNFCNKCGSWRGELGSEPIFDLFVKHLCDIFYEVKRILKKEGSCWVNLGDSYGGSWGNYGAREGKQRDKISKSLDRKGALPSDFKPGMASLTGKCLCQIPSRFSIEMINRGWILRNEINWWKRSCMPSSVKDRFTVDFEKIFFFTKNNKTILWKNMQHGQWVKEKPNFFGEENIDYYIDDKGKKKTYWKGFSYYFEQQLENITEATIKRNKYPHSGGGPYAMGRKRKPGEFGKAKGRNMRTTWDITTKGFRGAHFATYPEDLCVTPILAGCPEGGVVLDPFMGSGTTGVVAKKLGRNYVGIELNETYIKMAEERIEKEKK